MVEDPRVRVERCVGLVALLDLEGSAYFLRESLRPLVADVEEQNFEELGLR